MRIRRLLVRCSHFVLPLILFFGMTAPTLAEPSSSYTIEKIVLSSDEIPGGRAIFGDLRAPSINAHAAIAFNDGFGLAIYSNADGAAVGPLARSVGQGDRPPGILGRFGGVDDPSLNDDGSFAFRGFGSDSSDRGIYHFQRSPGISLVADASTLRPGTQETFTSSGPGLPLASDGGHILFSHATASTRGVYRADLDATTGAISLTELVALGSQFPESPGSEIPPNYSINDSGTVAMVLRRNDFSRGLYIARPDGSFSLVVQAGDPAPGGGNFTSNLGAPSINAAGAIAFQAGFDSSSSGIFVASALGVLTRIVDGTVEVPNHPGVVFGTFGFRDVDLANDGTVVFRARYRLDDLNFEGIYRTSSAGLEVIFDQFDGVVVDGVPVSLVVEDFGFRRVLSLSLGPRFANDLHEVGFLQELPPEPFGPPRSGIFVARLPETETSVLIDIKPGTFPNTVSLGSNGTLPVAILSTAAFDAARVDPATVTLANARVRLIHGAPMASLEDVDGNGLPDLVVHIETDALQISASDTLATLRGTTFEGVPIRGADSIQVVP